MYRNCPFFLFNSTTTQAPAEFYQLMVECVTLTEISYSSVFTKSHRPFSTVCNYGYLTVIGYHCCWLIHYILTQHCKEAEQYNDLRGFVFRKSTKVYCGECGHKLYDLLLLRLELDWWRLDRSNIKILNIYRNLYCTHKRCIRKMSMWTG